MVSRITQPSKEQVRAWMARRELALRPPPAPEDVRRELGWRLDEEGMAAPDWDWRLLFPAAYSQCVALDWWIAVLNVNTDKEDDSP